MGPIVIDSIHEPWYSSFRREVGEMLAKKQPLPPLPKYRDALPGEESIGPMVIETAHEPWFQSLISAWRSFQEEKKLPPLRLTARPIRVKSIWGAYDNKKVGVGSSLAMHVTVVALLFTVFAPAELEQVSTGSVTLIIPVDITPYLADIKLLSPKSGDTGGGDICQGR